MATTGSMSTLTLCTVVPFPLFTLPGGVDSHFADHEVNAHAPQLVDS